MEPETIVLLSFIGFVLLFIGAVYWYVSWRDKEMKKEGFK